MTDRDSDAVLQAVKNLEDIEGRVQGMMRVKGNQRSSMALSVEGQANNLIQEATNIDNLCEMYIGWGPFMWSNLPLFSKNIGIVRTNFARRLEAEDLSCSSVGAEREKR